MVPPDSLPQELNVPNLPIASTSNCVIFFGFIGSTSSRATGPIALSADLQATAP